MCGAVKKGRDCTWLQLVSEKSVNIPLEIKWNFTWLFATILISSHIKRTSSITNGRKDQSCRKVMGVRVASDPSRKIWGKQPLGSKRSIFENTKSHPAILVATLRLGCTTQIPWGTEGLISSAAECCQWVALSCHLSLGIYLPRRATSPETGQQGDARASLHSNWAAVPTLTGHPSFRMPSGVRWGFKGHGIMANVSPSPCAFLPPSLPSHKWSQEHPPINLLYFMSVSEYLWGTNLWQKVSPTLIKSSQHYFHARKEHDVDTTDLNSAIVTILPPISDCVFA